MTPSGHRGQGWLQRCGWAPLCGFCGFRGWGAPSAGGSGPAGNGPPTEGGSAGEDRELSRRGRPSLRRRTSPQVSRSAPSGGGCGWQDPSESAVGGQVRAGHARGLQGSQSPRRPLLVHWWGVTCAPQKRGVVWAPSGRTGGPVPVCGTTAPVLPPMRWVSPGRGSVGKRQELDGNPSGGLGPLRGPAAGARTHARVAVAASCGAGALLSLAAVCDSAAAVP